MEVTSIFRFKLGIKNGGRHSNILEMKWTTKWQCRQKDRILNLFLHNKKMCRWKKQKLKFQLSRTSFFKWIPSDTKQGSKKRKRSEKPL